MDAPYPLSLHVCVCVRVCVVCMSVCDSVLYSLCIFARSRLLVLIQALFIADDSTATCTNGRIECGEDELPCGNDCLSVPTADTAPFCDSSPGCAIADGSGSSAAYGDDDVVSAGADAAALKRALAISRGATSLQLICRDAACFEDVGKECTRVEATATLAAGTISQTMCTNLHTGLVAIPGVYTGDVHVTCGCPSPSAPTPAVVPRFRGELLCGGVASGSTGGRVDEPSTASRSPEHIYTIDVTLAGIYVIDTCDSSFDTELAVLDDGGVQVAGCDDCGNCSRVYRARLAAHLAIGRYSIVVKGHGDSAGSYTIEFECPTSTTTTTSSGTTTTESTSTVTDTSTTVSSTITTTTVTTTTVTTTTTGTSTTASSTTSTATSTTQTTTTTSTSTTSTVSSVTSTTQTTSTLVEFVGILECDTPVTQSTAAVGANSIVNPNPSPEHNYDFVAGTAGNYTIDSCESDFDTYIWVLNSTGGVMAECDDFCDGSCSQAFRTRLTVSLPAGNYRVVIEGHRLSQGAYRLEVQCPPSGGRARRQVDTAACDDRITVSVASRIFGEAGLMADVDEVVQRVIQPNAASSNGGTAAAGTVTAATVRVTCERAAGTACVTANCSTLSCGPTEVAYISTETSQRACCPVCLASASVPAQRLADYDIAASMFAIAQRSQEAQYYARSQIDWANTITTDPAAAALTEGIEVYLNRSRQGGSCESAGDCVATTTSTTATRTTTSISSSTTTSTTASATTTTTVSFTSTTISSTSSTASTTVSTSTTTLVEFVGTLLCDTPVTQSTAVSGANAIVSPNPSAEHNYNFVAATAGVYILDSCGSDFDTFIWILDSAGAVVAQCDDFCDGSCAQAFRTRMSVTLPAGSYRVVIEGHRAAEGVYRLNVACP